MSMPKTGMWIRIRSSCTEPPQEPSGCKPGRILASEVARKDAESGAGDASARRTDAQLSGNHIRCCHRHLPSFANLLGDQYEAMLEEMSLEKQVTAETPPCFLWHTAADDTVPVENSLLMAMALRKAGVPVELHVFPDGEHGLSLASNW